MASKEKGLNYRDHILGAILGLFAAVAFYVVSSTLIPDENALGLTSKLTDISVTFSFTILGFLFTAYSVLQFLDSKSWARQFRGSSLYHTFCLNLKILIVVTVVLFFLGVGCLIVGFFSSVGTMTIAVSALLAGMVYIAVRVTSTALSIITLMGKE